MASKSDIEQTLTFKYGAESELPSWTKPFIHAVGLVEKLHYEVVPEEPPIQNIRDLMRRRHAPGPSAAEREIERRRMREEVVANLESVSILPTSPINS
jgi:hypothetical protein